MSEDSSLESIALTLVGIVFFLLGTTFSLMNQGITKVTLFGIVFVLVGILLLVFGLTDVRLNTNTEDPFAILRVRYAKGEITGDQFEEMKKNLN